MLEARVIAVERARTPALRLVHLEVGGTRCCRS